MKKEKYNSCDMCGNAKEGVKRWKGGGRGNWESIFLCPDCWEIYKEQKKQ